MFYFSSHGDCVLDFSDHKTQKLSLYQAKFTELNIDFSEMIVLSKGQRMEAEEAFLQKNIYAVRDTLTKSGLTDVLGDVGSLLKLPIGPYREIEQCLGLTGKEAYAEIGEGFANVGYNYGVKQSTASECLFNL